MLRQTPMYTHQARIISDGTCGCPRTFTTNSWAGTWPPNKSNNKFMSRNLATKQVEPLKVNQESIHMFFPPKKSPKIWATYGKHVKLLLTFFTPPPPPWGCEVKGFSLRILSKEWMNSTQLPAAGMEALASPSSRSASRCITPSFHRPQPWKPCTHRIHIWYRFTYIYHGNKPHV